MPSNWVLSEKLISLPAWQTLWEGQGEKPQNWLISLSLAVVLIRLAWRYVKQKTQNDAQAYLGPISGREEESEEEAEGAEKPACQGGWEQQIPLRLQPIKWQKSKISGKIPTSLQIGVLIIKKNQVTGRYSAAPTSAAKKASIYDNKVVLAL